MEQRQQKPALILKYAKRRFDGGSEIELIRSIEVAQMNKLFNNPHGNTPNSFSAPLALAQNPMATQPQQPQPAPVKRTRKSRMLEAAIRGPLQLCIGVVGMLTAGLAIVTFRRADNEAMLKQSWQVFHDCRKTLQKGVLDCLNTPVRVIQAGLKQI